MTLVNNKILYSFTFLFLVFSAQGSCVDKLRKTLSELTRSDSELRNSKIVKIERFPIARGALTFGGKKHIGILENGQKVIIKEEGSYIGTLGEIDRLFSLKPEYEVAAYELSKLLGFDVVPPTFLRTIEINGVKTKVSVQTWVDRKKNFSNHFTDLLGVINPFVDSNPFARAISKANKGRKEQLNHIFILDFLGNIHDRHGRNVLIDSNNDLVAIDNGLSFNPDIGGRITRPRADKIELNTDVLEQLKGLNRENLSVLDNLLSEEEIQSILLKRDLLLSSID